MSSPRTGAHRRGSIQASVDQPTSVAADLVYKTSGHTGFGNESTNEWEKPGEQTLAYLGLTDAESMEIVVELK
jgi:hypothetical protein